jgi:Secretion system C-terminal sorting domain
MRCFNFAIGVTAFLSFAVYNAAHTQELTPRFEMQLFFEDAMGNRDTLEVGYDERASYDTLLPAFGEFPIQRPFDSVLDVRAIHFDAFHDTTAASKRIISSSEEYPPNSNYIASAGDFIMIHAKYLPITITYDSAHLNNSGFHDGTLLTPTWEIFLLQYLRDVSLYYCMSPTNSIIDDFEYFYEEPDVWLGKAFEVEGMGWVDLPAYILLFRSVPECATPVDVKDIARISVKVYPNPTRGVLSIKGINTDQAYRLDVFDTSGKLENSLNSITGDVVNLPSWLPEGLYLLRFTFESESVVIRVLKN